MKDAVARRKIWTILRGKSTSSRTDTAANWGHTFRRQFPVLSARHLSPSTATARVPSKFFLSLLFLLARCSEHLHFFSFRAGRYDSTERHCRSCGGYEQINREVSVFPVQVTKGEHRAIQAFRTNANPDEETVRHVQNSIRKVLVMMIEGGMILEPESDASDVMDVTAERPSFLESEGDDEYGPDDMLYF
jgi:hypothetical protein